MDTNGLSWLFAALGGLLIGLGIPLVLEKVGPNRFYGFRTRKTLSSAAIWYPINRVMGYDLLAAGAVIAATAACVLLLGHDLSRSTVAAIHLGTALLCLTAALLDSALILRKM